MPNEKKGDEEHGVRLSYKFRIYPTPSQCEAIKANIDASRFVYNHYLRARMDAYERTQQEVRRPKPACDEQGNVQYDQDGKEIWERTEGGKAFREGGEGAPERRRRLFRPKGGAGGPEPAEGQRAADRAAAHVAGAGRFGR